MGIITPCEAGRHILRIAGQPGQRRSFVQGNFSCSQGTVDELQFAAGYADLTVPSGIDQVHCQASAFQRQGTAPGNGPVRFGIEGIVPSRHFHGTGLDRSLDQYRFLGGSIGKDDFVVAVELIVVASFGDPGSQTALCLPRIAVGIPGPCQRDVCLVVNELEQIVGSQTIVDFVAGILVDRHPGDGNPGLIQPTGQREHIVGIAPGASGSQCRNIEDNT